MTSDTSTGAHARRVVEGVVLDHPVERVWRAITDPAEVGMWFASRGAGCDPRPGGRGRLRRRPESAGRCPDDPDLETTVRTSGSSHADRLRVHVGARDRRRADDEPTTLVEPDRPTSTHAG